MLKQPAKPRSTRHDRKTYLIWKYFFLLFNNSEMSNILRIHLGEEKNWLIFLYITNSCHWLLQKMNFWLNLTDPINFLSQGPLSKVTVEYFFGEAVSLARLPEGIWKFLSLRVESAFPDPSGMFQRESRDVCRKLPFFFASSCSLFGMPERAFILQREIDSREFVKWRKRWNLGWVHYLLLLCGQ